VTSIVSVLLVAGFAKCKPGRVLMRVVSSRDVLHATRFTHPISESANRASPWPRQGGVDQFDPVRLNVPMPF
jgi:hypothetical protein